MEGASALAEAFFIGTMASWLAIIWRSVVIIWRSSAIFCRKLRLICRYGRFYWR